MALSKKQLEAILQVIQHRYLSFTYEALGPRALTEDEIRNLQRVGLLSSGTRHMVADSMALGRLVALLPPTARSELTYETLLRHIKSHPLPLTEIETRAMEYATEHAGEYIKGIKDMVLRDVKASTARAGMTALNAVKQGVSESIANRETVSELKTRLFDAIDNRTRDWQRIAHTEINTAVQYGIHSEIMEKSPDGADQVVFKRPAPDACFPAGAMVLTRRGNILIENVTIGDEVMTHRLRWRRVSHVMSRDYDGNLVRINGVWATDNHPFLVGKSWLRADAVKTGDEIVKIRLAGDAQHNPPSLAKDNFLSHISASDIPPTMPIASINLYCDLLARDADVDVVNINRHFRYWREVFKHRKDLLRFLGRSLHGCLARFGAFAFRFWSESKFAHCTRSLGDFGFFRITKHRIASLAGFGEGLRDAIPFQNFFYIGSAKTEVSGNRCQRGGGFSIFSNDISIRRSDGAKSHKSLFVESVAVNDLDCKRSHCQVFNLEIEEDHSFFAGGIAVHNCVHCKRLYLSVDGMTPRVFKLSDLAESNIGLKAASWKAVVGSTHPWCNCQLQVIPEGYDFRTMKTVIEPFKVGAKQYKRGELIDDSDYDGLDKDAQSKIGRDAILSYTGKTAEPTVEKSFAVSHVSDDCVCDHD